MNRAVIEAFASRARNLLKQQIGARISMLMKSDSSAVVIENRSAMTALMKRIEEKGNDAVIDEVAYTWFNRLCALRYMDVHGFNRPMAVTPENDGGLPEILDNAMGSVMDDGLLTRVNADRISRLMSGEIKSINPQDEIYRILLVSKCNALNKELPMLFERISDYTDLLLPEDLLSPDAIIPLMREALTEESCETVEVIGWLYQYYIAEKKDEVFEGFRKGKKATSKEIPAATQLFTPDWIVRYLVENSLGRLWMLNHPESGLAGKMEYYIKPVDTEPDFIRINNPEEIRICDPCCGSGHMLTYAFDILFEIYSELGYTTKDAVEHIIRDNLYGIELDDRAGQLAYFALMMKAREKVRRFFSSGIEPNICVLHNVTFDEEDLRIACSLFSNTRDAEVKKLLTQFEHADTFGSLIIPCIDDIGKLKSNLTKTTWTGDLFDGVDTIEPRVHEVLKYADYLSPKYQVVITNPPYMGNYDDITKAFVTKNYPDSKSDLCTAFMERNWKLTVPKGYSAMVNMQ
ncbi:MAG: BREX-1 system adenine-specific DNA-methyltransferase PglX, partial [Bullifex sp.]